jgi:hypothetical protein
MYLIIKGFGDSFACGCDTTDSVRYHLRANKIDLSLNQSVAPRLKAYMWDMHILHLKSELLATSQLYIWGAG